MITRIELTNFMSHAKTVIEPAPGLTVLVGPNNVGKSAIVAALQILCHNDNSTYVMRHGERECSVVVHTDDGHVVQWRRKNSPGYVIDGQTFDRLTRGGIPAELHQALRLARVDATDDADFDIHFGTQKSPIFLLSSSASNAARFFASSSDAIRLVEVQKRHKDKLAEAQREKNRREAESRQLNTELTLLEPVPDLDRRLEAAEQCYTDLLVQETWLSEAAAEADQLDDHAARLHQLAAHADALSPLAAPPTLSSLGHLEDLIAHLELHRRDAARSSARLDALAGIAPPPVVDDLVPLARLSRQIEQGTREVALGEARRRAFGNPVSPPTVADTNTLERLLKRLVASADELERARRRQEHLQTLPLPPAQNDESALNRLLTAINETSSQATSQQDRIAVLAKLAPPTLPSDTAELAAMVKRFDDSAAVVRACEQELAAATKALTAAAVELREQAAQSTCTLCGSPLDPDRVLARAISGVGEHDHE